MINISKICEPLPRWMRRQKLVKFLLALSPKSNIQLVKLDNGAKLFADISDPFPRTYFLTKSYDPEFYRIATPFMQQGGTFFDVGANFGFCTFGLISLLKPQRIYCHLFEANRNLCDIMEDSISLQDETKVALNHACVCDQEGESLISIEQSQLGESYASPQGTHKVKNIVLDCYIERNQINSIEFMKMDIEGSEPAALKGAEKSLQSGIIKAIYLEISEVTLTRNQKTPQDCFDVLRRTGFELFFVKKQDVQKGYVDLEKSQQLVVNGQELEVYPLDHYPANYDTDILAVHKNSGYVKETV